MNVRLKTKGKSIKHVLSQSMKKLSKICGKIDSKFDEAIEFYNHWSLYTNRHHSLLSYPNSSIHMKFNLNFLFNAPKKEQNLWRRIFSNKEEG